MRRHLPRLLLTGALLSPASLYALGLGEIRLNSALNQPFDADIELIAPTNEELASLKIGLANNDLFSRYGLDRPQFLSSFEFSVARRRDGNASIKVTSNRSVTEPFVTLLIEASWGRGRLLREYTVLLDPPAFSPTQPEATAPVTAPTAGARNERIERTPAEPSRPAEASPTTAPSLSAVPNPSASERPRTEVRAASPPAAGAAPATGSYTVERNETLWRIAAKVQPGATPSVINQTMIALFRANPTAFGGNINRLLAGSILRIPDTTEIESVSRSEATAEVARQQDDWSSGVASTDEANRLRLVSPAEAPASAAPATADGVERPAATRPPAATAPTQSSPAAPDKRLEVTNPGLASAQRNAAPPPVATSDTAPIEPTAEAAPADAPAPTAETAPAPVEQTPPTPAAAAPETEPSLLSRLGDFWWVFVVLGLLVVALLVAMSRRRRGSAEADTVDSLSSLDYEPPATRRGATSTADAFAASDDDETRPDLDEPPTTTRRSEPTRVRAETVVAPAAAAAVTAAADDTLSSESAVRFDQQDALAEADFHMAYGLYDQAADLVKIAIGREPQRRDLKMKLLEIYFVWGNRDLFLDTARDLHRSRAAAAPAEWDKVVIMGKQIAPEDPIFKDEDTSHVDLVDVNLEGGENRVDVDLFAEPDSPQPAALDLEFGSGEHTSIPSAESDLDLNLDSTADRYADIKADEPTREFDPLSRTQETPTVESPQIDRAAQTIREKIDKAQMSKGDQTAEMSLDDLDLDVDALEATGSLEETHALTRDEDDSTRVARPIRDDEMTQLAPSLSSFDRTMEAPRIEKFDIESTGTIYIDQVDLAQNAGQNSGGGDTVEQARPEDLDSTASLQRMGDADVNLDDFSGLDEAEKEADSNRARGDDTLRHAMDRDTVESFSKDVFLDEGTEQFSRVDLDVGDALDADDGAPTNRQVLTNEMELSELEPVTMSEVGTKLDLARAYMDMGDPDGARSILEEVAQEGNANQKQEAQRLLDAIR
jgi:pilus assembly protein FimV